MTTPTRPVPVAVEQWIARSKYLRWIDGLSAWPGAGAFSGGGDAPAVDRTACADVGGAARAGRAASSAEDSLAPISGWIGLAVSRSLRPGDRAWFVRDGRADSVLVTARHGVRLSIALPNLGEVESISVRRTRVFLVPW